MKNTDLIVRSWPEYELLDSGANRKLERFGQHVLIRPETQAIWEPKYPELWKQAKAEFRWVDGKGGWKKAGVPDEWESSWGSVRYTLRLTSFKHTGIFPEQASNWEWIHERVRALCEPRVLNLFGYTGIASVVAALAGAHVTHVDASKQSNTWAECNARLSGVSAGQIKFLLDDALKFSEREVRRGAQYHGIIVDPPAFGRGAKGEVWKIEESLPRLINALAKLFSKDRGAFFLLNGYAAGYSAYSFAQATESHFGSVNGEFGELSIQEHASDRCVPSGIYARFIR